MILVCVFEKVFILMLLCLNCRGRLKFGSKIVEVGGKSMEISFNYDVKMKWDNYKY